MGKDESLVESNNSREVDNGKIKRYWNMYSLYNHVCTVDPMSEDENLDNSAFDEYRYSYLASDVEDNDDCGSDE